MDRRRQPLLQSAPDLLYKEALSEPYNSAKSPGKPLVTGAFCPDGVKNVPTKIVSNPRRDGAATGGPVSYTHLDVYKRQVLGVSGGVSYGALGGTHHAVQDVAFMRAVPGLQVLLPADANSAAALTRALVASSEPAYIRVGRGDVEDIYPEDVQVEIGKAITAREGTDAAIIACGEMVYPALKAAELLAKDGLSVRVVDMHTIKPLDIEAVLAAAETGKVVTVEEHSVHGGLGGAAAEVICQAHPVKMRDVYKRQPRA